jgi:hypothetical protein
MFGCVCVWNQLLEMTVCHSYVTCILWILWVAILTIEMVSMGVTNVQLNL